MLGARDWQDMFAQKGSFLYIGVVFQSLPSISREIRQFVPSDCLQGNKDDGNHSSRPRYKCMERELLTRGDCLREVQLLTEEAPLGGGRTCV